MMRHGHPKGSAAYFSASLAVFCVVLGVALCAASCAKEGPSRSEGAAPGSSAAPPATPSEGPVPPAPSPAIVVPRPTMKTVKSETRPLVRSAPADPLLPTGAETPRLPSDFVIGPIGKEADDQGAYLFAVEFLAAVSREDDVSKLYSDRGRENAPAAALLVATLQPVSPRAGSGVVDANGDTSFLVRFVGKERSSQGELHLIRSGSSWLVDELILDEPVEDYGADGAARFDPFTYTRFL